MEWFRKFARRASDWVARRDPDAAIAEEAHLHREERIEDLVCHGVAPKDAIRQAHLEFGSTLLAIEDSRSAWHLGWAEDFLTDLRYGLRGLRRDRSFALTAILSLALGIGINTTIFSLASEFLFSEPSVTRPSSVVSIRLGGNSHADPDEFRYLRESGAYAAVVGHREGETNWRNGDSSRRMHTLQVTHDFISALGVPLAMGRSFHAADRDVVILSHRFWRLHLNSDSGVLSRAIMLDGRPRAIIAVLPEVHRSLLGFGVSPDLYVPLEDREARLAVFARLPDGMTIDAASHRTHAIATAIDRERPLENYKRTSDLRVAGIAGLSRSNKNDIVLAFFGMLIATVGLVLVIACLNVASLMLARASARGQEMSIRTSIGASRGRIVRQLLAESTLVALFATAAGVLLNVVLTDVISSIQLPLPVPISLHIQPDWRLLLYSAAIAILCALSTGLLAALPVLRFSSHATLLSRGSRQVGAGSRMRSALVAGQVAVTCLVLAAAFLFLRNLARSTSMQPGFDTDRVVWASVRLIPQRYPSPEAIPPLIAAGSAKLRALPGVDSTATVNVVPFNDQETHGGFVRADGVGQPLAIKRVYNRVSPGYFRTMGIPILAGREFGDEDRGPGANSAIVNQALAVRAWGDRAMLSNIVGRTLTMPGGRTVTIVGVCRNMKFLTIGEDDKPAFYEPYSIGAGDRSHRVEWMVRTHSPN